MLAALDAALAFLRESLIPHAQAEDAVLYPMVEQVMHAPGACNHEPGPPGGSPFDRGRRSAHATPCRAPPTDRRPRLQPSCTGCTPSSDCTSPRKRSHRISAS